MATAVKVVLSRKAFDSSFGGCASPILPDGVLVPLPIPDTISPIHYEDITIGGYSVGRLVADLTRGRQRPSSGAHLDPDVIPDAIPRATGWRPLFGQGDSAQATLQREGVGAGDLFLFFGWFRCVEESAGTVRFVKGEPDIHLLWGWLQVETVLNVASDEVPPWAAYHPHVAAAGHPLYARRNTIYVAREQLEIGAESHSPPGGGAFRHYDPRLQLTRQGASTRTLWSLPVAFAPSEGRPPLGYHGDLTRWSGNGDRVDLRTVGRGQEFVLDTTFYPEVLAWVRGLFAR